MPRCKDSGRLGMIPDTPGVDALAEPGSLAGGVPLGYAGSMSSITEVIRLHADGASRGNPGPAAYGFVLLASDGTALFEGGESIGETTNNIAEYTGLIAGLEKALELGLRMLEVRLDSELVVRQLSGQYRVRNEGLKPLFARAAALCEKFESIDIQHVGRNENKLADALANAALNRASAKS